MSSDVNPFDFAQLFSHHFKILSTSGKLWQNCTHEVSRKTFSNLKRARKDVPWLTSKMWLPSWACDRPAKRACGMQRRRFWVGICFLTGSCFLMQSSSRAIFKHCLSDGARSALTYLCQGSCGTICAAAIEVLVGHCRCDENRCAYQVACCFPLSCFIRECSTPTALRKLAVLRT